MFLSGAGKTELQTPASQSSSLWLPALSWLWSSCSQSSLRQNSFWSRHSRKWTWGILTQQGFALLIFWGYRGKDSYFQLFARDVLDNRCLGLSSLQFAGLEPCSFSVSLDSHWERCSFISSYPRSALVNCEDAKKERRERAAHMLAISSVSFTIYVEEESEGKASGWD